MIPVRLLAWLPRPPRALQQNPDQERLPEPCAESTRVHKPSRALSLALLRGENLSLGVQTGLLVLSLLLVGCPKPPAGTAEIAPPPSQNDLERLRDAARARVDTLSTTLETLRELKFKRPVHVDVQTLDGFRAYVQTQLNSSLPEQAARLQTRGLEALGLVPSGYDLRQGVSDMVVSQAGAYYDPEKETFYILSTDLPAEQLDSILIHELEHAMQDQHFNLKQLQERIRQEPDEDRRSAISFVLEGEASYIMMRYELFRAGQSLELLPSHAQDLVFRTLRDLDRPTLMRSLQQSMKKMGGSSDIRRAMEGTLNLPPYLFWSLYDPYLKGQYGVHRIWSRAGWEGVSGLFEQPPRSTEQMLHPAEPGRPDDEPQALSSTWLLEKLGPTWKVAYENTLGEAGLMTFFETHLTERRPEAAEGWDGDRYSLLENQSGQTLLVWQTLWDGDGEAAAFTRSLQEVLRRGRILGTGAGEQTRIIRQGALVILLGGAGELAADSARRLGR